MDIRGASVQISCTGIILAMNWFPAVHAESDPRLPVDIIDQAPQTRGVLDLILRLAKDDAQHSAFAVA
jgi:hypothetical protein